MSWNDWGPCEHEGDWCTPAECDCQCATCWTDPNANKWQEECDHPGEECEDNCQCTCPACDGNYGEDGDSDGLEGAEKVGNAYDDVKYSEPETVDEMRETITSYLEKVVSLEAEELEKDSDLYKDADEDYQKPYGFKAYKQILKLLWKIGKEGDVTAQAEMAASIVDTVKSMMGLVLSSDEYLWVCQQSAACQKIVERGIFVDIVSPASPWQLDPVLVEEMYECLMTTMTKCNWRQYTLKLQLNRLEFYSANAKYDKMPKLMEEITAFCLLTRAEGGAAENVRKNSQMTLKSIQMSYEYDYCAAGRTGQLLGHWDIIEGLYNECMVVMAEGIVISDKGTVGRIHEFGGMVQMLNSDYGAAFGSFQESFKTGGSDTAKARRLNYMLLSWILKTADLKQELTKTKLKRLAEGGADDVPEDAIIDPFSDPEVKNHKDQPEISTMKVLFVAFMAGNIGRLNEAMATGEAMMRSHHFMGQFYDTLQRFARTQAALQILSTYTSIKLDYLGQQVGYNAHDTEQLVVSLILDGLIRGAIDQDNGILRLTKPQPKEVNAAKKFSAMLSIANTLATQASTIEKARSGGKGLRGIADFE